MYVCVCRQVIDRDIHDAVAQGACRMRDLRAQLAVSAQCGKCADCARAVLKEAREVCANATCPHDL
mgnify:CR=1 FL=1